MHLSCLDAATAYPNALLDILKLTDIFLKLWQLLSLDLDTVISQGMVSLSHKQKLIDDCLSKSFEIALGNGAHGRCLVWLIFPSFNLFLFFKSIPLYALFSVVDCGKQKIVVCLNFTTQNAMVLL